MFLKFQSLSLASIQKHAKLNGGRAFAKSMAEKKRTFSRDRIKKPLGQVTEYIISFENAKQTKFKKLI